MGFVACVGACLNCGQVFSFNPVRVPSINKEPLCRECIEWANPLRVARGLKPFIVHPEAYSACDESELQGD